MFCLHVDNPVNKKPVEIGKPDVQHLNGIQPGKGDPPQIIGPVELPERKNRDEAQLDRPDAGSAGHAFDKLSSVFKVTDKFSKVRRKSLLRWSS